MKIGYPGGRGRQYKVEFLPKTRLLLIVDDATRVRIRRAGHRRREDRPACLGLSRR